MKTEIKEKLDEAIEAELDRFLASENGSQSEKDSIDNLNKLIKLELEDCRIEYESTDRFITSERMKEELEFKKEEMNNKKIDSVLRTIVDGVKIVTEIAIVGINLRALKHMMSDAYKFEETGTICSDAGKKTFSLVPKLFRTK